MCEFPLQPGLGKIKATFLPFFTFSKTNCPLSQFWYEARHNNNNSSYDKWKHLTNDDGAFICSAVFFWEAVWEISRKVYTMTRKYQEMGFITNLEHILSHPWFALLVRKLNHWLCGQQRMSKSAKGLIFQSEFHQENRKQGGSRCFHNLLKSWESEGQGTALLFGKMRESQEAVYGVTQSRTQLKWLSSSSSRKRTWILSFLLCVSVAISFPSWIPIRIAGSILSPETQIPAFYSLPLCYLLQVVLLPSSSNCWPPSICQLQPEVEPALNLWKVMAFFFFLLVPSCLFLSLKVSKN